MSEFTRDFRDALVSLRRQLHQEPEIAHQEKKTAGRIAAFLSHFEPDELITGLGGEGIAAVFRGRSSGPRVMIRCELDALPIGEENQFAYKSIHAGKGHLCGHDGHMVMVCGLAPLLSASRPVTGEVVLLFQPAEETGEGARLVVGDRKFSKLEPDYIFALHNLPGFPQTGIITRNDVFASASKGLIIKLKGVSSHAGHPEDGKNPSLAASLITQALLAIPSTSVALRENAMVTPIHTRIGGPAFGTSPGEGVVMFTLRSHSNEVMDSMIKKAVELAGQIGAATGISIETSITEPFEAVVNDDACIRLVEKVAGSLDLDVIHQPDPFPWSEDFGVFTGKYRGALFGLGSGTDHKQLHNERYDFPDEITEHGTKMFFGIIGALLNKEPNH